MTKNYLRGAARQRRAARRSPSFAVKLAWRLRARALSAREFPLRPARQIALAARRREDERLMGGRRV